MDVSIALFYILKIETRIFSKRMREKRATFSLIESLFFGFRFTLSS